MSGGGMWWEIVMVMVVVVVLFRTVKSRLYSVKSYRGRQYGYAWPWTRGWYDGRDATDACTDRRYLSLTRLSLSFEALGNYVRLWTTSSYFYPLPLYRTRSPHDRTIELISLRIAKIISTWGLLKLLQ